MDILTPAEAHTFAATERIKALQLRQMAEQAARRTLALLARADTAERNAAAWDAAAKGDYLT